MDTNIKLKSASEIVYDKLTKILKNDKIELFIHPTAVVVCEDGVCKTCKKKLQRFLMLECNFVQGANVKIQFHIKINSITKYIVGDKEELKKWKNTPTRIKEIYKIFKNNDLEIFVSKYPVNMLGNCEKCNSRINGRSIKCFVFNHSKPILEFYVNEDNF